MTGTERIMAALTGKDTDRHPYTMVSSLYGAKLIDAKITDYYRNPEIYMKGQQAVIDRFDPDIVVSPFSFTLEAEAFGCELSFLKNYAPNIKVPVLKDFSQIKNLQIPEIQNSSIQYFLKSVQLLSETVKGEKLIASALHSPCDLPASLMGLEMWIDTILFHPKESEMMLEKTYQHFVNLANKLFESGSNLLVIPLNFTNPLIISEKMLLRLLPFLDMAFKQLKGPVVIHNGGCTLTPFLKYFANLPNVVAFVLDPRESFSDARKIIFDEIVLMGNIDGPGLINLKPDQIKEKTLQILNDRKHDKRFIFCTANADISYDTDVNNLEIMVHTIQNYKK